MATKKQSEGEVDAGAVDVTEALDPKGMVRVRCLDSDVRLIVRPGVKVERDPAPKGQELPREFNKGEVFRIERQHAAHLGDRFEVLEK